MSLPNRILLVEDEPSLQDAIILNLELENYYVSAVSDGNSALKEFRKSRFDLIVLDVMLPEIDGFAVCQTIRLENNKIPILMLTAKDSSNDKVQGLRIGADDYLTKPFNLDEFLLRVKNLLKTSATFSKFNDIFHLGNCEINFPNYEIIDVKGNTQQLSKKEIMLLKLLTDRKNEVVSRREILETVWGYDVYPSTRTIDNFILNFRKYFEENPREPKHFHSVRGVGYKFIIPTPTLPLGKGDQRRGHMRTDVISPVDR